MVDTLQRNGKFMINALTICLPTDTVLGQQISTVKYSAWNSSAIRRRTAYPNRSSSSSTTTHY